MKTFGIIISEAHVAYDRIMEKYPTVYTEARRSSFVLGWLESEYEREECESKKKTEQRAGIPDSKDFIGRALQIPALAQILSYWIEPNKTEFKKNEDIEKVRYFTVSYSYSNKKEHGCGQMSFTTYGCFLNNQKALERIAARFKHKTEVVVLNVIELSKEDYNDWVMINK